MGLKSFFKNLFVKKESTCGCTTCECEVVKLATIEPEPILIEHVVPTIADEPVIEPVAVVAEEPVEEKKITAKEIKETAKKPRKPRQTKSVDDAPEKPKKRSGKKE